MKKKPTDPLNELALFAGGGGGILGGKLLGWRTRCAVEIDAYARRILLARQADGCLPPFPIWDDVRTFDGRPWRGRVDVVSGGFPCQDISAAGTGEGLEGQKSGLWTEMARIVGEVQPAFVFVENSPVLTSRGLGRVLSDLAALGYDARWGVLGAAHTGAPHERERIWLVAHTHGAGCKEFDPATVAAGPRQFAGVPAPVGHRWATEPGVERVAYGVASRMDRLRAIGNGQVPDVVALAWKTLTKKIKHGQDPST